MIPYYRPPYGLATAVGAMLWPFRTPDLESLEQQYASELGVADAVIVPAVRSAILMLIRAALPADGLVVGPAYTCVVVHEAMHASGRRMRFVEPAESDYAVPAAALRAAAEPGCCLILSELYGIAYPQQFLADIVDIHPALRIIDAAMGIPDATQLRSMRPTDVTLFSFGMGKSLCAGGGGVALFADRALATQVRALRDSMVAPTRLVDSVKSNLMLIAGIALRTRILSGSADALRTAMTRVRDTRRKNVDGAPKVSTPDVHRSPSPAPAYSGPEWTHQMTGTQRKLAALNLRRARRSAALRLAQARKYLEVFGEQRFLRAIDRDRLPQSHFPIFVTVEQRTALKRAMRARGIDGGDGFEFSGGLRRQDYPSALRISQEVLTLPLGESVSMQEIELIARCIVETLGHSEHHRELTA